MRHIGSASAGHVGNRDARGLTLAALEAAATANQLIAGEAYYITDKNRMAFGTSASTYRIEPRIYAQSTTPSDALAGDIWIETP